MLSVLVTSSALGAQPALAAGRATAVTAQACVGGAGSATSGSHGRIAYRVETAGRVAVGHRASVVVRYWCTGSAASLPISGLPVAASSTPSGIFRLDPAKHVTSSTGVVTYEATAVAPGSATLTLDAEGRGRCASTDGRAGCAATVRLVAVEPAGLPLLHPWRHLGIIPPANPETDAPGLGAAPPQCETRGSGAPGFDSGAACAGYFLRAINAARAVEHVPAMRLPADWSLLTVPEQLFVLADLERVGRGLPPYVGLSASLDAIAQKGAQAGGDPTLPPGLIDAGASTWAGDSVSTVAADYEWVYDDGYGSGNGACTQPHAQGCWAHRDGILGQYTGLECTDCVMGAGAAFPARGGWQTSLTEMFVTPTRPGELRTFFTWKRDVLPYLTAAPRP